MADWTDEEIAKASEMWRAGKSAREISRALGERHSRNSVISRLRRSGVAQGREGRAASAPARRPPQISRDDRILQTKLTRGLIKRKPAPPAPKLVLPSASPRPARVPPKLAVVEDEPDVVRAPYEPPRWESAPLVRLGLRQCRWPVGPTPEPAEMDAQLFCGAPTGDGQTWCAEHRKIGFTSSASDAERTRAAKEYARKTARYAR